MTRTRALFLKLWRRDRLVAAPGEAIVTTYPFTRIQQDGNVIQRAVCFGRGGLVTEPTDRYQ